MGVVIPIRSFVGAKERLADRISGPARAELARLLATTVVGASSPLPVVIVSSAPEVHTWAGDMGAMTIDDPAGGLDAAAEAGCAHLTDLGFDRAIVAHADLPDASALPALVARVEARTVVLVPCHRDDGTNVVSIPLPCTFAFSYGPGSFRRHEAAAQRLGLDVEVVRRSDLAFDVDVPADYELLLARRAHDEDELTARRPR